MPKQLTDFFVQLPDLLVALAILAGGLLAGFVLKQIIFKTLRVYSRREDSSATRAIIQYLRRPATYFLPVLVVSFLLPVIPLPPEALEVVRRLVEAGLVVTFAWGLIGVVDMAEQLVKQHYQLSDDDNLRIRKLFTQLQFVRKLAVSLIVFLAAALILMSFATVRKLGAGLLTSAGIASVIVGFAAQRSIGNLLAGFQLAFTQPIRIDDVLVVEGEWGRVEEITFTYVVLRIWDERRLVLPINYFIEKPFQNWTRTGSQLLGTVFLYTDYTIPVEGMRTELQRIVAAHPLWDGRVCVLQITDSRERTLELRLLVSAANSAQAFELRCDVRERMIAFVQQNYPECLPKTRTVSENDYPPGSRTAVVAGAAADA